MESAVSAVKRGFKRSILFPQIRSAILTHPVYPLLAVCPNLESFATSEDQFPFLLKYIRGLTALQKLSCPLSLTSAASKFVIFSFGAGSNNTPTAVGSELPSLQQITITLPLNRVPPGEDLVGLPQCLAENLRGWLIGTAANTAYPSHSVIHKPQNFGP